MSDTAIVTVAVGEKHLAYWRQHCELSWRTYAQKHQYDLLVFSELLDHSAKATGRSPAWQKCLTLGHPEVGKYERVVLIDCDIVVNVAEAPRVTDQVERKYVGGVISGSHLNPDLRNVMIRRLRSRPLEYEPGDRAWREDQAQYYQRFGLEPQPAGIVQTGVLVASPRHHRELLEGVYAGGTTVDHRSYEQIPLSHALLGSGVFRQIDSRFNSVFFETMLVYYPYLKNVRLAHWEEMAAYAVQTELGNNFFLHFAYVPQFAKFAAGGQTPPWLKDWKLSEH